MRKPTLLLSVALIVVGSVAATAYAEDYQIDTEHSELVVQLFKEGFASAIAHNHAIKAEDYAGGATFDKNDPKAASLWVEVQTASLKADEPKTRERYGLTKEISDTDRQKIQATMLSEEQMDSEKYPTMKFRSTSVEKESDQEYRITGDLTIHGETRSITFPITVEEEGGTLRSSATIDFRQSDFGIQPYSAMFGAVRNQDAAVLHATIVLTPAVPIEEKLHGPASGSSRE